MSPTAASPPVVRCHLATRGLLKVRAVVASVAVVALAAGCQSGGSGSGSAAGTSAITVAAIQGIDDAPLYIAAKDGLFRHAGLDVTIQRYQSAGQELQALKTGHADVAEGDYADFFYAAAATPHPDLVVVADGYHAGPNVMEVLVRPDSGIAAPQNLIGKTIGTPEPQIIPLKKNAPYNLETIATQSVLENDGVNPAAVHWKPLPSEDLVSALSHHQVDAILVTEPYILKAETQLGAIAVLDSCSGATASLPLSGYFTLRTFADKNPGALELFRSALQRAQAAAVLPGSVHTVVAHFPGMNMKSASMVTVGAYPTSLDAASLQRVADLMFNFNVLTSTLSVAAMIFNGPRQTR